MKRILILLALAVMACSQGPSPAEALLERIDPGASKRIETELVEASEAFFEIDVRGGKPVVRADSYVHLAVGLNWYLKYYCGIQLSRECLTDWMALHGVDLPLAAVGDECVWRNFLLRLGYSPEEAADIIAGPAYLAWFEMNNIEQWGGPLPEGWFPHQEALQKRILQRMKEWGMRPVLPGYSGMVPHDASEHLGLDAPDQGLWNNIQCPSILSPTDARFAEIAAMYYEEQERLFGKAEYYSMDPFHESKNAGGVDFAQAGLAVLEAMKKASPDAVWVLQAWSENPRDEMLAALPKGDVLVLDLFSECRPKWGMKESLWYNEKGFQGHDWLFCLLQSFGGRVGLHGRMGELVENYAETETFGVSASRWRPSKEIR